MTQQWSITPYVVGLLLDAPDDVSNAMTDVFLGAEHAAHMLGLTMRLQAAQAVMTVYVQHSANEARALGIWPELADWLERAAYIMVADVGIELTTRDRTPR